MTDHPDCIAQLNAVLVDPYDDAPRLILADWLEEHAGEEACAACNGRGAWRTGQYGVQCKNCYGIGRINNGYAERAEFIRVQVEISRMLPRLLDRVQGRVMRHAELRTREHELWKILGDSFDAGNLPPSLSWDRGIDNRPSFVSWSQNAAIVSRGFVSEVRCTLADWYGGECRECGGSGSVNTGRRAIGLGASTCLICSGTGRIVGRGPEIVRQHPVTRVEISDVRPLTLRRVDGRVDCGWHTGPALDLNLQYGAIPKPLMDRMPRGYRWVNEYRRWFKTEAAARDALSLALVNWAREQAGLPELRGELAEVGR